MKKQLLVLIIFLAQTAVAQQKAFKLRADQAFSEKDYVTAAYYYDKALEEVAQTKGGKVPYFSMRQGGGRADSIAVRFKLAESYRLYQNYTLAQVQYQKITEADDTSQPLARLWYGISLRCNNQLEEAIAQLNLFISSHDADKAYKAYITIANNELKDCQFAMKQVKLRSLATIEKLEPGFSEEENDFALSINRGKYWFTGTSSGIAHKYLNQIFESGGDSLSKTTVINFSAEDKTAVHYGSPSVDSTGQRMYLSTWYKEGDKTFAAIYLSKYQNGQWGIPLKLNTHINAKGSNAMQPFVSPDGRQLYFISNRTGGLGGYDIWLSDLDPQGLPINAKNLGDEINTGADENTPYYHPASKRLVFSSKGYIGMGNFDLYESIKKSDTSWTTPLNLGMPYNSTKDDLYYLLDDKQPGTAYVSSDRESDCCLNLFKINFVKPPKQSSLFVGRVTDCATGNALSGVKVSLVDSVSGNTLSYLTSGNGRYEFKIALKRAYQLRLEKQDYFTKVVSVPAFKEFKKDTLYNADICLQMFVVDKPIVIENVLYDFNKAILKPESLIVLDNLVSVLTDNPKIRIELSAHTDSIGTDAYNMRLSQQRAQSCVDYIVSMGIAKFRISAKGYGETKPISPNSLWNGKDNREGRRLNRRTEFKVVSID